MESGDLEDFDTLRVLQSPPEVQNDDQLRLRRMAEDRLRHLKRIIEKRLTYKVEPSQQLALPI